jgi:hypothetical protein
LRLQGLRRRRLPRLRRPRLRPRLWLRPGLRLRRRRLQLQLLHLVGSLHLDLLARVIFQSR